jgi:hypothetical protein
MSEFGIIYDLSVYFLVSPLELKTMEELGYKFEEKYLCIEDGSDHSYRGYMPCPCQVCHLNWVKKHLPFEFERKFEELRKECFPSDDEKYLRWLNYGSKISYDLAKAKTN